MVSLKTYILFIGLLVLAACQQDEREGNAGAAPAERPGMNAAAPPSPYRFLVTKAPAPPLPVELSTMPLQLRLARAGFSPGVIDGRRGQSLEIAIRGFQAANDLPETGELDAATDAALGDAVETPTIRVVIPADFAGQRLMPDLPDDAASQAKLPALGYRNLIEALAERFHTTPETLVALNSPETPIGAGRSIVVPNIGGAGAGAKQAPDSERGWDQTLAMLGIAAEQPAVERIVVDKSGGWLRGYGADNRIVVQFPVTMGSRADPLPLGNWVVKGVARNPDYSFDPTLLRGVKDSAAKQILPPGPNSPVGVVWIDLSKPHYGIHGTPDPATIGRAESNGCVRLTNWDAAKLAQMVKPGVKVRFQA